MTNKMTNKEARDLLARIEIKEPNEVVVNSWWGSFVKDYKEAFDIAIEALEQQPCDDTISRQAVLSYISNELGFGDEENGYDLERKIAQEEIYNFVKKMPSVTPKEKMGKSESENKK